MVAVFPFLLIVAASVASANPHRHSHIPNVVAVHVEPSVPCAKRIGAALKAAGCDAVLRTDVQTDLASMCSFEVTNSCNHISAISKSEGFIKSFPVHRINRPNPLHVTTATSRVLDVTATTSRVLDPATEAIHTITGVLDARNKLGLTGKGIKVASLDGGVYYKHPALGGGFGPGYKVAFGYDLVGDNYNGTSASIVPDSNPIDNCSPNSEGTHLAGILAADATNIITPGFVPGIPFTGVAPGVTYGSYRIFGCNDTIIAASDIVAAAVFRAAQDGADIILLAIGQAGYTDSVDGLAAQIVGAGRILVAAQGSTAVVGAYATRIPGASSGVLGITSFDNIKLPALGLHVDGIVYPYTLGRSNGNFTFNVPYNKPFVVNNPKAAASHALDDGCTSIKVNVTGKAVLLLWREPVACSSTKRCNNAAAAGAAACIIYYEKDDLASFGGTVAGSRSIPTLVTTLSAGQAIIADLAANKAPVVVPTTTYSLYASLTGGTLSSFSSPGLTNELFLKPDLGGIGGNVLSTISPFAATNRSLPSRYAVYRSTDYASAYVAGCIALLLQKRGKIGFDAARAYLQNTATVTNIYNTSLIHSPAYQGAGLVNVYKAATTGTLVTPSSISLNDTANHKGSQTIQIRNNYDSSVGSVTYHLSHVPAATANTFNTGDDFQLDQVTTTFNTNKIAKVKFQNSGTSQYLITIMPGKAVTIHLDIFAPVQSSTHPFPLYGGYISITNSFDSIVTNVPYAGVAGVWKDRDIWARNSTSLYSRWALGYPSGPAQVFKEKPASTGTGLYADATFTPLTNKPLQVVNASAKGLVLAPAASDSRSASITITYLCKDDAPLKAVGLNRTNYVLLTGITPGVGSRYFAGTFLQRDSYTTPSIYTFDGKVSVTGNKTSVAKTLPAGVYKMDFTAWKNFGSKSEVDVITTPPFQLVYRRLVGCKGREKGKGGKRRAKGKGREKREKGS